MSIRADLVRAVEGIASALALPAIARAQVTDPNPAPDRDAEFGLLALADGAVGLYYAWLGPTQADMRLRFPAATLIGRPPLEIARWLLADDDGSRSLGMAAINAITSHLYRRAGFVPDGAPDGFGGLTLRPGDRLGMVGYFPSLVRRALELGARVDVVERKAHLLHREPGLAVTLDASVLERCNQILCTGATLLNDSLQDILKHCRPSAHIALVGPTVGCVPDALFTRGIECVAGSWVANAAQAEARLQAGASLGAAGRRTLIRRPAYPGLDALIAAAQGARE
jgi:hypothetical protein